MLANDRWKATIHFFALLFAANGAWAADPAKNKPPSEPLQTILDRIRTHAANEDWRKEGWKDDKIEAWLVSLVSDAVKAANMPALKMPVRFSQVPPVVLFREENGFRQIPIRFTDEHLNLISESPRGLIIGKNMRFGSLRQSIVLADGDVTASVEDCIIIARGTINLLRAERSIVVAGTYIQATFSGSSRSADHGNVLISRGWATVGNSWGSIIAAQEGMHFNRAEDSVLMGKLTTPGNFKRTRIIPPPELSLGLGKLRQDPLATKIELVGVLHGPVKLLERDGGPTTIAPKGLVFRLDDQQYIAELRQPIVDENANPIPALARWILEYVSHQIAIFRRGNDEAVVWIAGK